LLLTLKFIDLRNQTVQFKLHHTFKETLRNCVVLSYKDKTSKSPEDILGDVWERDSDASWALHVEEPTDEQ
jgi:hypothetical protein